MNTVSTAAAPVVDDGRALESSGLPDEKRPKIAKATNESIRKSPQREVDSLERDLLRTEGKVVDQDKTIALLQKKIDKEEDGAQKKRVQADARLERNRARRDQAG